MSLFGHWGTWINLLLTWGVLLAMIAVVNWAMERGDDHADD